MQEAYINNNPQQVMRQHGKSFYFASRIFGPEQMENISKLYSVCRYIDDCADELEPEDSKRALAALELALKHQGHAGAIEESLVGLTSLGVKREYLRQLLDGAIFDSNGEEIKTRKDLQVYCYKVAGVVGLMMNPLLGVKSPQAAPFAVDLGMGMQLTNICRDVLEDAQNGRSYLPKNELESYGLSLSMLAKQGETPQALKELVKTYLEVADQYYFSSLKGLSHIPFRPRLAILVAAFVYRAIGLKLLRNDANVLSGRTYLSAGEKVLVTIKTIGHLFRPSFWLKSKHDGRLHKNLAGLPGINVEPQG